MDILHLNNNSKDSKNTYQVKLSAATLGSTWSIIPRNLCKSNGRHLGIPLNHCRKTSHHLGYFTESRPKPHPTKRSAKNSRILHLLEELPITDQIPTKPPHIPGWGGRGLLWLVHYADKTHRWSQNSYFYEQIVVLVGLFKYRRNCILLWKIQPNLPFNFVFFFFLEFIEKVQLAPWRLGRKRPWGSCVTNVTIAWRQ